MALTRQSVGVSESATVKQLPFAVGDFVRTHNLAFDHVDSGIRPFDVGQVKGWRSDNTVQVHWSQSTCACKVVDEDPAALVKITEGEYQMFQAGHAVGYHLAWDEADADEEAET